MDGLRDKAKQVDESAAVGGAGGDKVVSADGGFFENRLDLIGTDGAALHGEQMVFLIEKF